MNIAVDIDGVVADFNTPYLHRINKKLGKNYTKEDFVHFFAEKSFSLDKDVVDEIFKEMNEEGVLKDMPVMHFAKEVISDLHKKHNIIFVTARKNFFESAEEHTMHWLEKHDFKFNGLFFNHNKHDAASALNIHLFVEDSPENALRLAEKGVKVLLLDHQYNKSVSHDNITRVKNWLEIKNIISEL